QDPTDEVRSAAVRLAAARPDPDVAALTPLIGARRWPLTQRSSLETLPDLIGRIGLPDRALDGLLQAIAGMESSPVGDERSRFLDIVLAIGRDRLIAALELPDDRRLGVVRLLLEEGSVESLRAVADRGRDPLDEVRIAATSAKDQLDASLPEPEPESEPEPEEPIVTAPVP